MMKNLSEIYDDSFFKEWGRHHRKYVDSAAKISRVLYEEFKPKRIIDLGSGCCVYSDAFLKRGVEVQAVDGVRPPAGECFPVDVRLWDLTIPFEETWSPFDLALCLEVAEHIPEPHLKTFIQNITSVSDVLILSAAPPGQGGHHHVNEQPKRYWVKQLAAEGFAYNRRRTGRLVESFKRDELPYMWMGEHVSVYDRVRDTSPRELAFQTQFGPLPS